MLELTKDLDKGEIKDQLAHDELLEIGNVSG